MRCLIIDNYDSFTWNLADYVACAFDDEPLIVRNDQYTWRELATLGPFGCIIVSPGPGTVANSADVHVSRDALEQNDIPVLGVCLGHQGLAYFHGGKIRHAPTPFHGRLSSIHHDGSQLFKGLPRTFEAVRYHSLVVCAESLPPKLQVTARTEDGLIMGLRHVRYPKWGVQFHPESILTAHGRRIISNFRDEAHRYAQPRQPAAASGSPTPRTPAIAPGIDGGRVAGEAKRFQAYAKRLPDLKIDPANAFQHLYAKQSDCFWLDSQSTEQATGRFSFMGVAAGGSAMVCGLDDSASATAIGRHLAELEEALNEPSVECPVPLPFEFRGGYIGYICYEAKRAFGAATTQGGGLPCSAWLRADRFLAFDHQEAAVWLVAVARHDEEASAAAWMEETCAALASLPNPVDPPPSLGAKGISVSMDFGRAEYLAAIEHIQRKIVDGESYEVCLTNRFEVKLDLDPAQLYARMRLVNPAPFGAFIRVGPHCILSTSPERFIKVDAGGNVQTKPIKGTCGRSDDPAVDRQNAARLTASEKERAENLMIVDLLRNDLAQVSVPGSVRVAKLMHIESFQTVHHLVSTVESTLKAGCSLVDLLRAVFPGGSVTGAPKRRTMEIIDAMEPSPRGVYCGAIGSLGYHRIADLNVAIRTLTYDGTTIRFGAGGAITSLSDPEAEFQEMLLKAETILAAIWRYVSGSESRPIYKLCGRTLCLQKA